MIVVDLVYVNMGNERGNVENVVVLRFAKNMVFGNPIVGIVVAVISVNTVKQNHGV